MTTTAPTTTSIAHTPGSPATTTSTSSATTSTVTVFVTVSASGGVSGATTIVPPAASVASVTGTVSVLPPKGKHFEPVSSKESIPSGSTVDAAHGTVSIALKGPNGKSDTGQFSGGEFVLERTSGGATTVTLTGGSFARCKAGAVIRELWVNAPASVTAVGRWASVTGSAAKWLTEDRCAGTYVSVATGTVTVTPDATHKGKTLRAPKNLLVEAP